MPYGITSEKGKKKKLTIQKDIYKSIPRPISAKESKRTQSHIGALHRALQDGRGRYIIALQLVICMQTKSNKPIRHTHFKN